MKKIFQVVLCVTALASIVLVSSAVAGSFEEADKAIRAKDYKRAHKHLLVAAEEGNVEAEHLLGIFYRNGNGVEQNYSESMKWHLRAAQKGYSRAEYVVGAMYAGGMGVPVDFTQAVGWYQKAALKGFSAAQANLAICYYQGNGVPKSLEYAYAWLSLAAKGDNKEAKEDIIFLKSEMSENQIIEGQQIADNLLQKISS